MADSLAVRELTAEAQIRVRRSQLEGESKHLRVWAALHAATNPDPLGAAIGALQDARLVLGANADRVLAGVLDWIDQRLV